MPTAIGGYSPKSSNYDHQAILTAARLFEENTVSPRRLMLVVSDGFPSGVGYEGEPAIAATRESVAKVRRRGMGILNIAVDDFRSEDIFGRSNVLKFVDLRRMVSDLRNLMVRIAGSGRKRMIEVGRCPDSAKQSGAVQRRYGAPGRSLRMG